MIAYGLTHHKEVSSLRSVMDDIDLNETEKPPLACPQVVSLRAKVTRPDKT